MNQLEIDLQDLMKLITPDYWPNRSGLQHGFDAFSKFRFNGKDFFWKIESKDLNSKHQQDWSDVEEIETDEFAEKIMQIMGTRDRDVYPDVFCVFAPHKRIGSNTVLREDIKSWNIYNKFPFKIIILDYDTLSPIIPHINARCANSIYPNAPDMDKSSHDAVLSELKDIIRIESEDGYFHRRSYIRERNVKSSVWLENNLHIKVEKVSSGSPTSPRKIALRVGNSVYSCLEEDLTQFSVNRYPQSIQPTKPTTPGATVTEPTQVIVQGSQPSNESIDQEGYQKYVDAQKIGFVEKLTKMRRIRGGGIISLLNNVTSRGTLKSEIAEFCKNHPKGHVIFFFPREIVFAELPVRELSSVDFGFSSDITFYMDFEES